MLGSTSPETETVKNTGGSSLTVSAAVISGAGFSYAGLSLPLVLAPNQASTFSISFKPTGAGASSGNLSLTVSGSPTAVDIGLSGTGVTRRNLDGKPHEPYVHERASGPEFDANGNRDQHGQL